VSKVDTAWAVGRVYMGLPARLLTRANVYGRDRVPATGGAVYAINHLHWVDVPLIGSVSPRTVYFVAKTEAADYPLLGGFLRLHGAISIRRGESDRDAVRQMRETARNGEVVGLFVEGTRQRNGRPGTAQPGAAMVALQEDVPVIPVAIYGTQDWTPTNLAPCSVAFGEPVRFETLPRNGRGYREATVEIERRIHALFDWLAGVQADGRPPGLTPPL
jgi:1-acyl-sn-glycerol-3-phosphate acyltransferase